MPTAAKPSLTFKGPTSRSTRPSSTACRNDLAPSLATAWPTPLANAPATAPIKRPPGSVPPPPTSAANKVPRMAVDDATKRSRSTTRSTRGRSLFCKPWLISTRVQYGELRTQPAPTTASTKATTIRRLRNRNIAKPQGVVEVLLALVLAASTIFVERAGSPNNGSSRKRTPAPNKMPNSGYTRGVQKRSTSKLSTRP